MANKSVLVEIENLAKIDRWLKEKTQIIIRTRNKDFRSVYWARVERQFQMEKKHLEDKKVCDRKECPRSERGEKGKFRHHYYSISLIFMHNKYLLFLFPMDFSVDGDEFRRRQCAIVASSFIIFHIKPRWTDDDPKEYFSSHSKVHKVIISVSPSCLREWTLNGEFMEISNDGDCPPCR